MQSLIISLWFIFTTTICRSDTVQRGLTTKNKQTMLDLHNAMRNMVAGGLYQEESGYLSASSNMNELLWDKELQDLAQSIAQKCGSVRNENNPSIGENVVFMNNGNRSSSYTMGDIFNLWTDQQHSFHQIISAKSRFMACAMSECSFLCLYFPASDDTKPYKLGTPCNDCDGDRDNQCDSNDKQRNYLCAGGLDSSFHIDGTIDIDRCDNGLGIQISNVCHNDNDHDPQKRHLQSDLVDLPSSCQGECDAFSVSVTDYENNGDNVCITYKINRLFSDELCSYSIQNIILTPHKQDIDQQIDFNELVLSFDTIRDDARSAAANIMPDIHSIDDSGSSDSSSSDSSDEDVTAEPTMNPTMNPMNGQILCCDCLEFLEDQGCDADQDCEEIICGQPDSTCCSGGEWDSDCINEADTICAACTAGTADCPQPAPVRRRMMELSMDNDGLLGVEISIDVSMEQSFKLCLKNIFQDEPDFSNVVQFERGDNVKYVCEEPFIHGLPRISKNSEFVESENKNSKVMMIKLDEMTWIDIYFMLAFVNISFVLIYCGIKKQCGSIHHVENQCITDTV